MRERLYHSVRSNLLVQTYALIFIGMLLLFSASKGAVGRFEGIFVKQCVWILLGTGGLLIVRRIDYRHFLRLAPFLYIVFLILLMVVLGFGEGKASRWIRIGWFTFQPSEFAKMAVIFALAGYLAERDPKKIGVFIAGLIIAAIPFLLVLKQPNLGTAFIFLLVSAGILFRGGCSRKQIFWMLGTAIVLSPFLWFVMEPYQKERIFTFLAPQRDPLGRGYNLLQSKITIGSGGIIGKGFLHGTQTKLAFLPEYHTDFIFCILGEEFGFLGVLLYFTLNYFFMQNILRIISLTQDRFARLVGSGILVMFLSQIVINISMTLGLFPVAGIPLPFLSYGGSFMIVSLVAVGVLVNIHENSTML